MAYERVQKSFGQSSSKKKHNPIVPPLTEQQTPADSKLSPKVKSSSIPSKEERDVIRRSLFEKWGNATPSSIADVRTHIQAKLTIGVPGDKYEQEADRVASQVVKQINAPCTQQSHENLQQEEVSEEDELQMKSEVDTIQRKEIKEIIEEEEELQMKPMVQLQPSASGMTATPELETSIQQARSGGQPLADNIRQPMEQAFGADFSGVKVHTDAQADQLNQSIQAKAFTTGQDVFFCSGEYDPGSRGGQELIAHELTHVVQQNGGAVRQSQQTQEVRQKKTLNVHDKPIGVSLEKVSLNFLTNTTIQRVLNKLDNMRFRSGHIRGNAIAKNLASDLANTVAEAEQIYQIAKLVPVASHLNNLRATGVSDTDILELLNLMGGADNGSSLYNLITSIGADNVAVLKILIPLVSGDFLALRNLITDTTGEHANHLFTLIPLLGMANVVTLRNLIQAAGAANTGNITHYISQAGGVAQASSLVDLLNRNAGNPNQAGVFLAAAGGNAAKFTNMHTALPYFLQNTAPAIAPIATPAILAKYPHPANLIADYKHYNERHRDQTFVFNYRNINMADGQTLWPYPNTTAANIQTYLETVLLALPTAPGNPPVPGATSNVNVGVGGMQARIRINNPNGNNYRISQFFPEQGTPGTVHFDGLDMVGIGKVLGYIT